MNRTKKVFLSTSIVTVLVTAAIVGVMHRPVRYETALHPKPGYYATHEYHFNLPVVENHKVVGRLKSSEVQGSQAH